MAVTLSAAACAGSSDQADEPIVSENADSADAMANEDSGLIIEQENPDETGNDVPLVSDDSVMSDSSELSASEDAPMGDDTEAVPEEIMTSDVATLSSDTGPESLDSTLDNEASANDDLALEQAVAEQPVSLSSFAEPTKPLNVEMDDADTSMASVGNFGQSSGILPPGVVASPGAAIFIKSKYESSPAVASASGKNSYVVVPGDTISGISKKIFGSFSHTKKIASWNGINAPFVIQPGDVIKFEATTAQAKSFSSGKVAGTNTFKVKHGDTLSKIAAELFGNIGAWKVLYSMNKGKISNPNQITAGMVLSYSKTGYKKMPAATAKIKQAAPKKEVKVVAPVVEEAQPAAVEEATASETEDSEMPVAEVVEEDAAPVAVEEDEDQVIDVNLPAEDDQ